LKILKEFYTNLKDVKIKAKNKIDRLLHFPYLSLHHNLNKEEEAKDILML
jgi:hypothetical protein